MNRIIMEGLAVESLKNLEEYADSQIRSICQGFPPCLRYVDYRRCTEQEEYDEITRLRSNKRSFDLADSYVYLVKYFFIFTDQLGKEHTIERFLYLPFVDKAGIFKISGSTYHIVPVLSDKVFTPGDESIFVRLTQDRNNMYRVYNTIMINNRRETRHVVWAIIYRSPEAKRAAASAKRPKTILTHYLFAKYGFKGAFERYAGAVPEYGYIEDMVPEKYPENEWVVCHSTQRKPDTCQTMSYRASKIALAVRRKDWSAEMESMVFGFFYVIDHFPERFGNSYCETMTVDEHGEVTEQPVPFEQRHKILTDYFEDISLWMILIGIINLGDLRGENILYKEISDHFESLDAYLDTESKKKLAEKGIVLENYYDLLAYISTNFNIMIKETKESTNNVYGKNLEILSYLLYDILYDLTSMKFSINKAANRRPLSLKDVTSNFQQFFKAGTIFRINSGKIISESVSYSGDHMYPAITAVVAEQEGRSGAVRGKSSRVIVGPQHRIDLSMVTVGSVLNLPKANPTPVARINPWVTIDEKSGTVLPNPDYEELINANRPLFKL